MMLLIWCSHRYQLSKLSLTVSVVFDSLIVESGSVARIFIGNAPQYWSEMLSIAYKCSGNELVNRCDNQSHLKKSHKFDIFKNAFYKLFFYLQNFFIPLVTADPDIAQLWPIQQ